MAKKISALFLGLNIISSIILVALLIINAILPVKYRILVVVILVLYNLLLVILSRKSKGLVILVPIILAIVSIVFTAFASYYINTSISAIDSINEKQETKKVKFSLVVLKDSDYKTIDDIKDEFIATAISQDGDNISNFNEKFKQDNSFEFKFTDSESYIKAANDLMDNASKVILLNDSFRSMIDEQIPDFEEKTRVIESFEYDFDVEDISKNVDKDQSFNFYISGIDTYGDLTNVSRSDVNLLLTVNPKVHKILITTIPRDSYLPIAGGGNDQYDKLTHAGMYGIESSVKTLENLFQTDINYYARVNFSTFMNVINVLDGVTLNNEQAFTSKGHTFELGDIYLNGQEALIFARERHALARGDLDRGVNQEKVLKAMIEKIMSPSVLVNYNDFLDILIESADTNMPRKKVIELINSQLDSNEDWDIETTEVLGQGQTGLSSYAMPGYSLYMYVLDSQSVDQTSTSIKNLMQEGQESQN